MVGAARRIDHPVVVLVQYDTAETSRDEPWGAHTGCTGPESRGESWRDLMWILGVHLRPSRWCGGAPRRINHPVVVRVGTHKV